MNRKVDCDMISRQILPFISRRLSELLSKSDINLRLPHIEEIRLRSQKPLIINCGSHNMYLNQKTLSLQENMNDCVLSTCEDIKETFQLITMNSVYAFQQEIKNGFITLPGGHRVGICGKAVYDDNQIKNIRDVSAMNFRISRQIKGCSSKLVKWMLDKKCGLYNVLIISPPQCGKTTILTDLALNLSNGIKNMFSGFKVGIVDERSEIAACLNGVPQKDVGINTDVLDGCPKCLGMNLLIRSMSPDVIITDEIGSHGDKNAVLSVVNAGVKIISTAHGYNLSELKSRKEVLDILESGIFDRYIVLSRKEGPGTLEEVIDSSGKSIYRREQINAS